MKLSSASQASRTAQETAKTTTAPASSADIQIAARRLTAQRL
jgi:hypothetical protein